MALPEICIFQRGGVNVTFMCNFNGKDHPHLFTKFKVPHVLMNTNKNMERQYEDWDWNKTSTSRCVPLLSICSNNVTINSIVFNPYWVYRQLSLD